MIIFLVFHLIPNYFEILKILQIFTPHSTSEQHLDQLAIKVGKLGLAVPTLTLKSRENSAAPSRLPSPTRHHGKRSSAARSFPNHQKYNSASMRPRACNNKLTAGKGGARGSAGRPRFTSSNTRGYQRMTQKETQPCRLQSHARNLSVHS